MPIHPFTSRTGRLILAFVFGLTAFVVSMAAPGTWFLLAVSAAILIAAGFALRAPAPFSHLGLVGLGGALGLAAGVVSVGPFIGFAAASGTLFLATEALCAFVRARQSLIAAFVSPLLGAAAFAVLDGSGLLEPLAIVGATAAVVTVTLALRLLDARPGLDPAPALS